MVEFVHNVTTTYPIASSQPSSNFGIDPPVKIKPIDKYLVTSKFFSIQISSATSVAYSVGLRATCLPSGKTVNQWSKVDSNRTVKLLFDSTLVKPGPYSCTLIGTLNGQDSIVKTKLPAYIPMTETEMKRYGVKIQIGLIAKN